jgi:hypothetical protein
VVGASTTIGVDQGVQWPVGDPIEQLERFGEARDAPRPGLNRLTDDPDAPSPGTLGRS